MDRQEHYILVINPGSTSTKATIFRNEEKLYEEKFIYDSETIKSFGDVDGERAHRLGDVHTFLENSKFPVSKLTAVGGRGGILPPIHSGAYLINELMLDRVIHRPLLPHASNFGPMLAYDIAQEAGVNAYIYDGVTTDEMTDVARVTGISGIQRYSRVHALNTRAIALRAAKEMGRSYQALNLIMVHLGGGITLSVHEKGRMVDVVLDLEGPFSPERAGRVLTSQFLNYSEAHHLDRPAMDKLLRNQGGLVSLCGTNDVVEVQKRAAEGDAQASLALDALSYQCAKSIGELATVVFGDVDAIVLTGPIAASDVIGPAISKRVSFIAPVMLFPGENEMESLAYGVLRVLRGEEIARTYDEIVDSGSCKELY